MIQECDNLPARTSGVGAEGRRGRTAGDALLHGPQHRIIVIAPRLHIGERIARALRLGRPVSPPQEGDGLGAGTDVVGGEGGGGGAAGDPLPYGPPPRRGNRRQRGRR